MTKDSYGNSVLTMPLLWCSMKTYYGKNGIKKDQWKWHDPFIGSLAEDQILARLTQHPPDIVGLSVFVWNEELMDSLAKKIKQLYPHCLIVYGGPQQNVKHNQYYFEQKPWVDLVLPSDAYGEIVLREILDLYPIQNYEQIPYVFYTNENREKLFSEKTIDKRAFDWPDNIFEAQQDYLIPYLKKARNSNFEIVALYDTSRGCPYKCIYCEWGGGTHTKVNKKPFSTVLDELTWLSAAGRVDRIEITDANFGIMSIDVEIARHLAELKKQHGFPINVDITNAKNNINRVLDIVEIFLDADMISQYIIPIQTLDLTTKKNIERIDIPFEDQIIGLRRLRKHHNGKKMSVFFESILGLPGDNFQVICKQIDTLYKYAQPLGSMLNHAWMLLPETPAFTAEVRDKFSIKTVKKTIDFYTKIKKGIVINNTVPDHTMAAWANNSVEIVVSTYSYTIDEWVDMYHLSYLVISAEKLGINLWLLEYLVKSHKVLPSQVLTFILNYIYKTGFQNDKIKRMIDLEKKHLNDWLHSDLSESGIDIDPEFPFLIPYHAFLLLTVLTNAAAFYEEVCKMFSEKYSDTKIIDLGHYISSRLLDMNYTGTRTFITKYNWASYFDKGATLRYGSYFYTTNDLAIEGNNMQEFYCKMLKRTSLISNIDKSNDL